MSSIFYVIIIVLLLLIILYQYLRSKMGVPSSSNEVKTVIETVKVTDMKIESKSEATIKLDLEPLTKPTDYDTMVGRL